MNLLAKLFGSNDIRIGQDHPDVYHRGAQWNTPRLNLTQQEINDFYYYEALARHSLPPQGDGDHGDDLSGLSIDAVISPTS